MPFRPSPAVTTDAYKVSHPDQYPEGTERVLATWIPRESRIPGIEHVVAFGFQAFIQHRLVEYFNENFFDRPKDEVLAEYERVITPYLGSADSSRWGELHDLGYLPLEIKALPEGTLTPLRVPMLTIENTDDRFYWLTNYIETLFSDECWLPSTSATIAWQYRKMLTTFAERTGGDLEFVPFQGHDFSMRGMENMEAAAASGAGHLLSFVGTDTIPAILWAEYYYAADVAGSLVGSSIPATEHAVMCAGGADNELGTFRRLINEVYPSGFVSIVSDTWDLWKVIGEILPTLKDDIMRREGKVVIRPDSGDPVDIIAGINPPGLATESLADKGVVECLWDIFSGTINSKGYKVLDPHIGTIYGDSITLDRAYEILSRLEAKGFASTNVVFGIGSFTYQYNTRDTFGFALKSTWVKVNGVGRHIFKDPATDVNHTKRSLKGRVAVMSEGDKIRVIDGLTENDVVVGDMLRTVFLNGRVVNGQSFAGIRDRLLVNLKALPPAGQPEGPLVGLLSMDFIREISYIDRPTNCWNCGQTLEYDANGRLIPQLDNPCNHQPWKVVDSHTGL